MSTFKSFNPKKYTRSKTYINFLENNIRILGKNFSNKECCEFCSNCGFVLGQHAYGSSICPEKAQLIPEASKAIIKIPVNLIPVKKARQIDY